jgi:hypothetical protein
MKDLNQMMPIEAWDSDKPAPSHLKHFGGDTYRHIPGSQHRKLGTKAQFCIFVGYVHNTKKLWRLWDPKGQRVVNSADMRFDENSFGNCSEEDLSIPFRHITDDCEAGPTRVPGIEKPVAPASKDPS